MQKSAAQLPEGVQSNTQRKIVKIYGSSGFANLHAYQTGVFISASGRILTAWSHVLDGRIHVVDSIGTRRQATFVGVDPETEMAILQTDHNPAAFFDLNQHAEVKSGQSVFGFSNLFGIASKNEPVSVMKGVVSVVCPMDGKMAQFNTPYRGDVVVVDLITNNPGAAGGAVIDFSGNLVGIIGKEWQDRKTGIWLNFCMPTKVLAETVKKIESNNIQSNKEFDAVLSPLQLNDIGIELVPNIVETSRPFVDRVMSGSPAHQSGLKPDDLIIFINKQPVRTIHGIQKLLLTIDRDQSITLTVRRNKSLIQRKLSRFPAQRQNPEINAR